MRTNGLDIAVLLNFVSEHDSRLVKRAPCFFSLCLPSITEEYKIQVFYHTSKKAKQFGVRFLIVAEEATAELMDGFEDSFKRLMVQFTFNSSMPVLSQLEEK